MVELIRKKIELKVRALKGGKVKRGEFEIDHPGFENTLKQFENREIPVPKRKDLQENPDAWYEDQVRCLEDKITYVKREIEELELYDAIYEYIKRAKPAMRGKVRKKFKLSKKHTMHYLKTLKCARLVVETRSGKMRILKVVEDDG